jgi:hypothetical protein
VWTAALDANASPIAVDLEQILDEAMEVVPSLLLRALTMPAEMQQIIEEHIAGLRPIRETSE